MSCCKTYDPCLDGKLNQIGSYAAAARSSAQSSANSAAQSSNSATSAAESAASAQSNATLIQNIYNDFSEKYLGSFDSPPTPPIEEGALYYNTVSNGLFVWNGTAWISADFNEFTNFTATGTTTARNLVTRTAEVSNVKDFGAVGDGITDDTAAFQAAAASGKLVFVPKPTVKYTFPSPLSIDAPVLVDPAATWSSISDSGKLSLEDIGSGFSKPLWRFPGRTFMGGATKASETGNPPPSGMRDWLLDHHLITPGLWLVGNNATVTLGSDLIPYTPTVYVPQIGTPIYGTGIPSGTTVVAINSSPDTIQISQNATATASNVQLRGQIATPGVWGAEFGQLRCLSNSYGYSNLGVGTFGSISNNSLQDTIGVASFAINNNSSTNGKNAYGGYFEAQRIGSDSGSAVGIEVDVMSTFSGSEVKPTPFQQSRTIGIILASGNGIGGQTPWGMNKNTGEAIQISSNPTSFKAGIVFGNTSIEGTDGYTGTGNAISMARGHKISWYCPGGSRESLIISSEVSDTSYTNKIFATESGGFPLIAFQKQGSSIYNYLLLRDNGGDSHITIQTGNPQANVQTEGSSADINLALIPKGAGRLKFGTHVATTDVPITGYIEILDSSGNLRKLAVIS